MCAMSFRTQSKINLDYYLTNTSEEITFIYPFKNSPEINIYQLQKQRIEAELSFPKIFDCNPLSPYSTP